MCVALGELPNGMTATVDATDRGTFLKQCVTKPFILAFLDL